MRVWIVNYYTSPYSTHPRYIEFAKHFMAQGWGVTTFYANYSGETSGQWFHKQEINGLDYVQVETPRYKGNGLKRMYSIWYFAWSLFKHCKEFERPDVILHNIHTPFDYPIVWVAKKLKTKYVAEAWDLWPEDFVTMGLVSRKNPALHFFYWVEKNLYYHADQMVFTFLGVFDYLKAKGWTKHTGGKIDLSRVHYINNGVNLEQFDNDRASWPRKDEDLNDPETMKIVYMGSINRANHVQTLVEAAKMLQDISMYRFFIYGDGADREALEKKVEEEGIANVIFKEKQIPLCEVAWVVTKATVNVMNYQKGFGYMGVSSGKLFQYLAAGKPIICNVKIAYDDVITDNHLGIAKDIETPEAFAQAIRELAEQPQAGYDAMCERVRMVAEQFDYKKLAEEEITVIEAAMAG